MGMKSVHQLVRISDKEIRNKLIDDWFKAFTYRTVFQLMNGCEQKTVKQKMRLTFLTKMQTDEAQLIVEDINLYLPL